MDEFVNNDVRHAFLRIALDRYSELFSAIHEDQVQWSILRTVVYNDVI